MQLICRNLTLQCGTNYIGQKKYQSENYKNLPQNQYFEYSILNYAKLHFLIHIEGKLIPCKKIKIKQTYWNKDNNLEKMNFKATNGSVSFLIIIRQSLLFKLPNQINKDNIFQNLIQSNSLFMSTQTSKHQNLCKEYVKTTNEQKGQIIDLVIIERYSMKIASQIVGVKLSTVKYIVKSYKNDKETFLKKLKPKKEKNHKEKKNIQELKQEQKQIHAPTQPIQVTSQCLISQSHSSTQLKSKFQSNDYFCQNLLLNYGQVSHFPQGFSQWNYPFALRMGWFSGGAYL